jgi:hypothetical protein
MVSKGRAVRMLGQGIKSGFLKGHGAQKSGQGTAPFYFVLEETLFERFGHPTHRMTQVSINGPLPQDIGTGFAEFQAWEFEAHVHPIIPAWFGKHFAEQQWAPSPLLAYLKESGLLKTLKVREAIIAFEKQTEVFLPEDRDQRCSIIGKFTQGSKADGKRLTRRLVTDQGELDFLCARHPPKRHSGWGASKVPPRPHPHILRRLTAPVHPPEGEHAGLCQGRKYISKRARPLWP